MSFVHLLHSYQTTFTSIGDLFSSREPITLIHSPVLQSGWQNRRETLELSLDISSTYHMNRNLNKASKHSVLITEMSYNWVLRSSQHISNVLKYQHEDFNHFESFIITDNPNIVLEITAEIETKARKLPQILAFPSPEPHYLVQET